MRRLLYILLLLLTAPDICAEDTDSIAREKAHLAACYRYGIGVPRDSARAVGLYLEAIAAPGPEVLREILFSARDGDAFANALMAKCYMDGVGVQRSRSRAIPYLEDATTAGSVESAFRLGLLYLNNGEPESGYRYFEHAASAGNVNAAYFLGKMLVEGRGIPADPVRGVDILTGRALSNGNAKVLLASCYASGKGVQRNDTVAERLLRQAASQGNYKALWTLGRHYYLDGRGTVPQDFCKAATAFAGSMPGHYERAFRRLMADTIATHPFAHHLRGMKAQRDGDFAGALTHYRKLKKSHRAEYQLALATVLLNPSNPGYNRGKGLSELRKGARTLPRAAVLLEQIQAQDSVAIREIPYPVAEPLLDLL